jgi:hypothetical protein
MDIKGYAITAGIVIVVLVLLSMIKTTKDGAKKSILDIITSK